MDASVSRMTLMRWQGRTQSVVMAKPAPSSEASVLKRMVKHPEVLYTVAAYDNVGDVMESVMQFVKATNKGSLIEEPS